MKLFSEEMLRDPYPFYEHYRRQSPLALDPGQKMWMLFDYEGVKRVLGDPENFSSNVAPPSGKPLDWLVFADPPRHTRLRTIFTRAFMPKSVSSFEPRIREVSRELINRDIERGEMDLIARYAGPFPSMVIADIIGIPAADQPTFLVWNEVLQNFSSAMLGSQPGSQVNYQQLSRHAKIQAQMSAYLADLLAQRRRVPRDDLLTRLGTAEADGEQPTDSEIMGFIQLLFSAATETSTNLIGNTVLTFIEHPEQLARLRADPGLLTSAVEEMLRFRSPIQTLVRQTRRPVEINGRTLPEGSYVFAVLGAANRDAKVFAQPQRFDIGRDPNPHIAFGYGAHYCMGLQLGKLEARIAIQDLFENLQDIRLESSTPWEPQKAQHVLGAARLRICFKPARKVSVRP
ncbi:MAG: cytochrome P450 [Candidatus Sericytochromatia bacterium]